MPGYKKQRAAILPALACCCLLGAGLPPARAAERAPIVAVLDIEDRGSGLSADVLDRLSDYLAVLMAEAGYAVVPREQVRNRLVQMKKESYKTCYDQQCQIDLGRELAAQKVLAPKVLQIGGECRLLATFLDLKLAASERAATVKADCHERGMLLALEQLVAKLTGQQSSGRNRPRVAAQPPRTTAQTPAPKPAARRKTFPSAGKKPAGKKPGTKVKKQAASLMMVSLGVAYPHLGDALTLKRGDNFGTVDSGAGVIASMRMDFVSGGGGGFQVFLGGVVHFIYAKDSGDGDSLRYFVLGMGTTGNIELNNWLDFRFVFDVGLSMHMGTSITMSGDASQLSITQFSGFVLGGVVELVWKMTPGLNLVLATGAMGDVYATYSDSNGEYDFKLPPHLFTSLGLETSF